MPEGKKIVESIEDILNRLFEESSLPTYESDDGMTGIRFSDENIARLKEYKAYSTETYSSVLLRLLESVEK